MPKFWHIKRIGGYLFCTGRNVMHIIISSIICHVRLYQRFADIRLNLVSYFLIINLPFPPIKILVFSNYLSLENGMSLYFNKIESPSPNDALCRVWLKLIQWFWRRIFLNFVKCIFWYFVIVSPLKRALPFIWTNLNPISPRLLCSKFD